MPVLENKRPIHLHWEKTKKQYDFTNAKAIGLVCGEISGGLEAIDIDSKYDLTGNLYKEYKKAINQLDKTLLKKLVVQKTVSGGYHFIYRCENLDGNKKLAQRYTTPAEREATYQKTYDRLILEGKSVEEATQTASKSRDNDKIRVLLETRGEKGYIACYPTKGYDLVHGDFNSVQVITEAQKNILFSVAYSFNEVVNEYRPAERLEKKQIKGDSPFEDYNNRADVVSLLERHGWKEVGKKGCKLLMLRPGDTKAEHSGNYDTEKKWFSVFSTSTEFESQRAYQPYAVYAVLECKSDFQEASRRLYSDGYGERLETIIENKISIPSIIDLADNDYSFLATPEDYEEYLDKWRKGTFEKGLSTGMKGLDDHFLFKEGNLVIINGIDNVGKSTVIWYLAMLSNMFHGWQWLIFSSENKIGGIIRKLIEFYWCEPIATMSEMKFKKAKEYVARNFDIIKVKESLFNYQDILNMVTKASRRKKYKGLMIDPYNSLKVDVPVKSKQSTYDYHYEAASVINLYGKNNNISIYLNCHVGTVGARNKDAKGFTRAPQKEDTEMGVMFANKADDFLTIHRVTQHATEWNLTELHVRKIKEIETGGRVTFSDYPVLLRSIRGLNGFINIKNRETEDKNGQNPILEFHEGINLNSQTDAFAEKSFNIPAAIDDGKYNVDPDLECPF